MGKILPLAIVLLGAAAVSGQESAPGGGVEFKDVKNPGVAGFGTIRVNGSLAGLLNARAKDVMETVVPAVPIIGVELLTADRRFEVNGLSQASGDDEILARLGDKLGLSIALKEATAEFIIVRNLTRPVPASWVPSNPQGVTRRVGVEEIDTQDHIVTANGVGMIDFVNFLTNYPTKPVWNQTSLSGLYDFSFRFHTKNVMQVLFDMGFDVHVARRTTRCVVIARKPVKE